jgi:hypothetical protein
MGTGNKVPEILPTPIIHGNGGSMLSEERTKTKNRDILLGESERIVDPSHTKIPAIAFAAETQIKRYARLVVCVSNPA